MRLSHALKRTGPAARGAFTFTELLIVFMVIAILVALTAGTVSRVIIAQKKTNTKVTIDKVSSQITKQWSTYKDRFFKENPAAINQTVWNYVVALSQGDSARARVIWVKLRLQQAFPRTFAEALKGTFLPAFTTSSGTSVGATVLPPLPTYVAALAQLNLSALNVDYLYPPYTAGPPPYESAACLLLALQQGNSGGGAKVEDLAGGSVAPFLLPPYPPTMPAAAPRWSLTAPLNALVDFWELPLQYSRWPVAYARLGNNFPTGQPGQPGQPSNDPTDPQATLAVATWLRVGGSLAAAKTNERTAFEAVLHLVPDRQVFGNGTIPMSYKLVPVLISCGPDKTLGLDPASLLSGGTGAENDNVDNLP